MEGLGFSRVGQKTANIVFEVCLVCESIIMSFPYAKRGGFCLDANILPIVLALAVNAAPSIAQTVEAPGSHEQKSPPWRQVIFELRDSALDSYESTFKLFNDCVLSRRPRNGTGVQASERRVNGIPELVASSSMPSLPVVAPSEIGDKASTKNAAKNGCLVLNEQVKEFFHGALFGLLIALAMFWLTDAGPWGGLKKPNV